jgi:uncharacterized protein (TIGR00290 family)
VAQQVVLAWSGGKDSALALQALLDLNEFSIVSLLTTITEEHDRVSMHGVRSALLESQAEALGLPLDIIRLSGKASNQDYGRAMGEAMTRWKKRGVTAVAFGDIHLQDVRTYREENLRGAGLEAVFPLWGREPNVLMRYFLDLGFRAVVTCVDTGALDGSFAGRELNAAFLADLPSGVDPCGENGEFHSFVYDGPLFRQPVAFRPGECVLRDDRFMFADLEPL